MEEINIKDFFNYYKKYILLVVMVVFLFVLGIGLYDKVFKTPMYSTYTTLVLVKDETSDTVDTISQSDIILNQKLVSTYREIIKSRLVLDQVIHNLNLSYTLDQMQKMIDVQSKEDTEILKITVTDSNARMASHIANNLAEVFDHEITKIYKLNNVSIIDKAEVPQNPSNNHFFRDLILAALIGFTGTSAIIFIIFYFDDTLRSIEEIEGEIGTPVIAKVYKDSNKIDLIVDKKPNSLTSESVRTLRTNLQFAAVDDELKTILVTSSLPSEGKSFISANLAISFAQAGKKVLIVDCDLRKGRQHKIFNVSGKIGLSNLLIGDINKSNDFIIKTHINNLSIIPRGVFPPNPSELLNSKKNANLINTLKKYYDIIILDGAPISGLADSLILSTYVDKVLLVTAVNYTVKTELKNTIKSLENVNAHVAGCVANNVIPSKGHYGGYYYYGEKE